MKCGLLGRTLGHSYVGPLHLLLALMRQRSCAGQLLRAVGVDPELTAQAAAVLHGSGDSSLPLPQGLTREARSILKAAAGEAKIQGRRERAVRSSYHLKPSK